MELEYDSHDIANCCRVIRFNVGNFLLTGEEKGKTNMCKQVRPKCTETFSSKDTEIIPELKIFETSGLQKIIIFKYLVIMQDGKYFLSINIFTFFLFSYKVRFSAHKGA